MVEEETANFEMITRGCLIIKIKHSS